MRSLFLYEVLNYSLKSYLFNILSKKWNDYGNIMFKIKFFVYVIVSLQLTYICKLKYSIIG